MPDELVNRLSTALRDRYTIDQQIGRGGMATVFLAHDVKHERPVALKVLHPELGAAAGVDRFLREVRVTAQLHHPHILPLFDSGHAGDLVFFVMPYITGESLRARLEREGQLPVDVAVRLAQQVADALDYAHRHEVIHRDIKPENILLHEGAALVADFGIALAAGKAVSDRLTASGLALGTPEYMSPEQATADPHVDARSDLFALGCVLYEMLAGEPPHTGATAQAIIARTVAEAPRRLRSVRPTVPPHVDAAVHRALAKVPADRFATAAEFAQALTDDRAMQATASDMLRWDATHDPVDRTFQLSTEVCRKLDRTSLDPRVIGDRLHYLDNEAASDVLVLYLHGLGLDQSSFAEILRVIPYRGLAPTLYGFEPSPRDRRPAALTLKDHVTILREFCRHTTAQLRPRVTILVGFSHGADLGFEVLSVPPGEAPLAIDGFLSLGANVDLGTCNISNVLAHLTAEDTDKVVADLRTLGSDSKSLRDWLSLHDYLVRVFRKFAGDIAPLRSLAREIVAPFETANPPFPRWYQNALSSVRCLRCVFSNSESDARAIQRLRLRHLDEGVLGSAYREDTILVEGQWSHFDLVNLAPHRQHIEEMLQTLRLSIGR